jgi:tripartite ATP-independent transporter DctM subunit
MAVVLFGVFVLLVLMSVPIAFALIGTAAVILGFGDGTPLVIAPQQIVAGMDSFPMLAVPLFILAGFIMEFGGISRRLVTLAYSLVGHLPGGLGQVVVLAETFFAGVSGSTSAQAAVIGGIMIPQLIEKGYSRPRATAIVGAACAMGILIPPGIVMVIYGVMASVSIGGLFVACLVPGLLMAVGLMWQIGMQARKQAWPRGPRATWGTTARAALDAAFPLLLVVIILGGIRFGIFTPTEAAAVAVAYALVLSAFYRSLTVKRLWRELLRTAQLSGMVLFVVGAAQVLGWVLAVEQVPQSMAAAAAGLGGGQAGFLLLTIVIFLPLGAILEGVPAVVLLTPILLPVAKQLGIDPIHYGTVICATQGISVFMPPVGVSLLVACSVGEVSPAAVAKPIAPYLILLLGFTLLITFVPQIVLFLPRVLGY